MAGITDIVGIRNLTLFAINVLRKRRKYINKKCSNLSRLEDGEEEENKNAEIKKH